MKINILEIAKDKGEAIAKQLMEKYKDTDFAFDKEINYYIISTSLDTEIYELALSYAKVFLFENKIDSLNSESKEELLWMSKHIAEKPDLSEVSDEELFASIIAFNADNFLLFEHKMAKWPPSKRWSKN